MYRFTGLFSRPSLPIVEIDPDIPTASQDNFTSLIAGRLEADLGANATLGLTLVNAHNGAGNRESFEGNPLKGVLTTGQLGRRLNKLIVRLSDDSPADGEGGPVLFGTEVEITTALRREVPVEGGVRMVFKDTTFTGSSIGFAPVIEGGEERGGFLRADGAESIVLQYALAAEEGESEEGTLRLALQRRLDLGLDEADDAITRVKNVRFRFVLANDYRIEVASDRQNSRIGIPEFLVVTRAAGNVKNQLNPREVVFDYGLPTASQIAGITAEVRDWWGFDLYGEFNVSTQYRQFPSTTRESHRSFSGIQGDEHAVGWLFNLVRHTDPWRFSLEGFGMDDAYATSFKPVDSRGLVDYSPEATDRLYDFVEDNDDQDRHPDQKRFFPRRISAAAINRTGRLSGALGRRARPGGFPWVRRKRRLHLRLQSEQQWRPGEFLPRLRRAVSAPPFGPAGVPSLALTSITTAGPSALKTTICPTIPTRRITGATTPTPAWRSTRKSASLLAICVKICDRLTAKITRPTVSLLLNGIGLVAVGYGSSTCSRRQPTPFPIRCRSGSCRRSNLGQLGRRAGSTLPCLICWRPRTPGSILFTLSGSTPVRGTGRLSIASNGTGGISANAVGRNGRETSGFVGLIDKIDGVFAWGAVAILPRFKSEFLSQSPFSLAERRRRSWDGIGSLLIRFPVMRDSELELGFEQRLFFELLQDEKVLVENVLTGDFRGTVWAAQLSNQREYLGYGLTTQLGLRFDRAFVGSDREGARDAGRGIGVFVDIR